MVVVVVGGLVARKWNFCESLEEGPLKKAGAGPEEGGKKHVCDGWPMAGSWKTEKMRRWSGWTGSGAMAR